MIEDNENASGHPPATSRVDLDGPIYRVWLAECGDWHPRDGRDVPPEAVVLEPAEEGTMPAREAARYVQTFNQAALASRRRIWAVAVPVVVQYGGDLKPGQVICPAQKNSPPCVCQASMRDGLSLRE